MRMWHYKLLPYLPDAQLRGQLRELVAIMHNWRDKGFPRNGLVNIITEYPKHHLYTYFKMFQSSYERRFKKPLNPKWELEFRDFCSDGSGIVSQYSHIYCPEIYGGWHDKTYLRICMANLLEKYRYAFMSKGKIDCSEMQRLCEGYRNITGEDYEI